MTRLVGKFASVLTIIAIAYAVPVAIYATWAWFRLRPDVWPQEGYPEMDPLGLAWQYWDPTPSATSGGSSYWAAIEQGERWRFAALCSIGVFCGSILAIVVRARHDPVRVRGEAACV